MTRQLIFLIVFLEGFASLGAEVIALRRLLPHVGSSIVVTAPTIGFFLLALALGYHAGGRLRTEIQPTLARNFLVSAALIGIGMSQFVIGLLFSAGPWLLGYLLFVLGVLAPVAYLLGQTVPALTTYLTETAVAERSGNSLYWSTLGSFLGSLSLSLGVMTYFGISAAVFVCAALLVAAYLLLNSHRLQAAISASFCLGMSAYLAWQSGITETAYADYQVVPVAVPGSPPGKAFMVNGSPASLRFDSNLADSPPKPARYISRMRDILISDLAFRNMDILVLGAGGFSLSEQDTLNHYTYVDIDPDIRRIAEALFLQAPARGSFIAEDARRHVQKTSMRYDAIVVDVFSSQLAIPRHLLTREFWREVRRPLKNEGVLLANLVLDSRLDSDYARNLLATVEREWGRCSVEVLFKDKPVSNVLLTCHRANLPQHASLYTDEHNESDMDAARSTAR